MENYFAKVPLSHIWGTNSTIFYTHVSSYVLALRPLLPPPSPTNLCTSQNWPTHMHMFHEDTSLNTYIHMKCGRGTRRGFFINPFVPPLLQNVRINKTKELKFISNVLLESKVLYHYFSAPFLNIFMYVCIMDMKVSLLS